VEEVKSPGQFARVSFLEERSVDNQGRGIEMTVLDGLASKAGVTHHVMYRMWFVCAKTWQGRFLCLAISTVVSFL